ncbi:MAG: AIPR family protein [Planctomycetes bacterium]|nr:AIPR family protein [Planctomycetota bacterium]
MWTDRTPRNIRYNLGGRVGRGIRETYEKKPKEFWYLHNGLTIICDEYIEKNQTATLIGPSVINGAQTLYSIASSPLKDSAALVTARVIVRGQDNYDHPDDDQWLQRVIRGVNTQNRVSNSDFRSNDPEQVELQRKFKEQRVFYERKKGEWKEVRTDPRYKGLSRVSMPLLGQILTAIKDEDGQGLILVKRGTQTLFEERIYKQLFPSRSKVAFRFKRIYFAYRLFRLLASVTRREDRVFRHALWHVLWVLHRSLFASIAKNKLSVEQLRTAFDTFEGYAAIGKRARKAVHIVAKAVWHGYRVGRKADPEHWSPPNFFKQRYGIRVISKVAIPKARPALGVLAKLLESWQA